MRTQACLPAVHLALFPARETADEALLSRWAGLLDVRGDVMKALEDARAAKQVAAEIGITLPEGVYAAMLGPSYETPAEVAMLKVSGADVVGMSTVPEVIAARALGMRVLGISVVTNTAADHGLSHDEVLEAGQRAAERLERLLTAILSRLT